METTRVMIKRVLALGAIALAVIACIVVVGNNSGNGNGDAAKLSKQQRKKNSKSGKNKPKTTKKTYKIQAGDTLTGIAQSTGISVARLEKLNPDIDPQALISGQSLKLR